MLYLSGTAGVSLIASKICSSSSVLLTQSRTQPASAPCPGWCQHCSHHWAFLAQFDKYPALFHPHPTCLQGLRPCGELGALLEKSVPGSEHVGHHTSHSARHRQQVERCSSHKNISPLDYFTHKDFTSWLFHTQRFNLCWRKAWTWALWAPPRSPAGP